MQLAGWRLTLAIAGLLLASDVLLLAAAGLDEAGVRLAVRVSAREAALLFVVVFAASSLRRLWPVPATKWLLANRRYLGVGFAAAHALHLATIALFATRFPDAFQARTETYVLVVGGLVSLLIALMALTSTDRAQRALGRGWRRLHRVGGYAAWAIYLFDYLVGFTALSLHSVFAVLVVGALGLRVAAHRRASGASSARAATAG